MSYRLGMATPPRPRPDRIQEPRWLNADELTAWRAIAKLLARLPTALEQQLQRDAQLSYLEYYVLAHLSDQPRRAMRMCDLAFMADVELSRLSHLVSRLERRGFLRREVAPTNRRSTLVVLADQGHAHLVANAPGHVDRVRELVIDALSPEALEALKEASERVVARIEGVSVSASAR